MTQTHTTFRDFVEQVRAATDIVVTIGKHVNLKPAGSTLKGLSPFHLEKHPSFVVWPGTQTWYDFSGGRGLGGDVFAYIQQRDQVSFKEAVFALARERGIKPPHEDEEAFQKELSLLTERREVERLLTQAATYYHNVLPSKIREQWCHQRYGFTDETVDQLQIGWANGHLFHYFTEVLEIDRELVLKTGLFIQTNSGVRDFFQDRLVFPYWRGGQVVYFIARRTEYSGDEEWELAKYKKLLTHSDRNDYVSHTVKNGTFYNEDITYGAEEILITEGVTDCISAMQADIPCISPVTTRFRKQDVPKLLELTKNAKRVTICNDSEVSGAGAEGALETATALFEQGRDVRIATLPRPEGVEKVDVNEYIKEHSNEEFGDVLKGARRYLEHLIDAIPADTSKIDLTPKLRPVLELLIGRSSIEQDGYVDIITQRFGLGKRTVKSLLSDIFKESKETDSKNADEQPGKTPIQPDGEALRGEVYEDADHYYIITPDSRRQKISSFQIEPVKRINTDDGEVIVGDVTTDKGTVFRKLEFPPEAWRGKQQFHRFITKADMQWTGADNNLQGVLRILSRRSIPICYSTETLGYLETKKGPRWVSKYLVIGVDGPVDEDITYFDNGSSFPKRVQYQVGSPEESRELAQRILPTLLDLNEPAVVLPMIGWFFATPFKPRIMKLLDHFPILMVHGTAGSGKTSLCKDIFWRLFGVNATEPFSATETEFPLIKLFASTNAVPVFIDEYKPLDMEKRRVNALHRFLRRIYGGEVEERGRADGTVRTYRLLAPVCIAGETRPDDAALVDRMVAVSPNRNTLERHPEYVAAYKQLREMDLSTLAASYIQFALQRDTQIDFKDALNVAEAALGNASNNGNISLRYRDNQLVFIFGLTMYEAFAEHMGVGRLPHLDIEAALSVSIDDLMDGERGAKTALDLFIEACSVMAYNGELKENRHYAVIDQLTCIHLRSCWDVYLEHCRRIGQPPHAASRQALWRMFKENCERGGYVKDLGRQIVMGNSRPRLIAIDLEQASEFLDVDTFPETTSRAWGGNRYDAVIGGWDG